jgi:hypothetical protein
MQSTRFLGLILVLGMTPSFAWAATYYELAGRNVVGNGQRPSATAPVSAGVSIQPYVTPAPMYYGYQPPAPAYYGPGPQFPLPGNSAMPMLPTGSNGVPNPRQMRWSYGQINAASDPFNAWGLSTQGMYVPWSTPTSSWTNAQGWDWWRNRAGDEGPAPPLW